MNWVLKTHLKQHRSFCTENSSKECKGTCWVRSATQILGWINSNNYILSTITVQYSPPIIIESIYSVIEASASQMHQFSAKNSYWTRNDFAKNNILELQAEMTSNKTNYFMWLPAQSLAESPQNSRLPTQSINNLTTCFLSYLPDIAKRLSQKSPN